VSQIRNEEHVRDRLSEHLEGDLSIAEFARVDAHLAHCEDCAAELRELRATVALLRELPEPELPADFAARVARRIDSGEGRRVSRVATFARRARDPRLIAALAAGFAGFLLMTSIDLDSGNILGTPNGTSPDQVALQSGFGRAAEVGATGARRPPSLLPTSVANWTPSPQFRTARVASRSIQTGHHAGFGVLGSAAPEAPLRDLDGEFEALLSDPAAFVERFRRTPEDARRPMIAPLVGYSAQRGSIDAIALYTSVGSHPMVVRTSSVGR